MMIRVLTVCLFVYFHAIIDGMGYSTTNIIIMHNYLALCFPITNNKYDLIAVK